MTETERLEDRLALYYDAEKAILSSQSYSLGGKTLTRANLADVQRTIKELETDLKVAKARKTGRKTKRVVLMD